MFAYWCLIPCVIPLKTLTALQRVYNSSDSFWFSNHSYPIMTGDSSGRLHWFKKWLCSMSTPFHFLNKCWFFYWFIDYIHIIVKSNIYNCLSKFLQMHWTKIVCLILIPKCHFKHIAHCSIWVLIPAFSCWCPK